MIEAALVKMGLPISSFTMIQLKSMNQYEKLLIELGEQRYDSVAVKKEEEWSPLTNLLILSLTNAVILIIIHLIIKYCGFDEAVAKPFIEQIVSWLLNKDDSAQSSVQPGGQPSGQPEQQLPNLPPPSPFPFDLANGAAAMGSAFINNILSGVSSTPQAPTQAKPTQRKYTPAHEE
jgi:hypothetical protein